MIFFGIDMVGLTGNKLKCSPITATDWLRTLIQRKGLVEFHAAAGHSAPSLWLKTGDRQKWNSHTAVWELGSAWDWIMNSARTAWQRRWWDALPWLDCSPLPKDKKDYFDSGHCKEWAETFSSYFLFWKTQKRLDLGCDELFASCLCMVMFGI